MRVIFRVEKFPKLLWISSGNVKQVIMKKFLFGALQQVSVFTKACEISVPF